MTKKISKYLTIYFLWFFKFAEFYFTIIFFHKISTNRHDNIFYDRIIWKKNKIIQIPKIRQKWLNIFHIFFLPIITYSIIASIFSKPTLIINIYCMYKISCIKQKWMNFTKVSVENKQTSRQDYQNHFCQF